MLEEPEPLILDVDIPWSDALLSVFDFTSFKSVIKSCIEGTLRGESGPSGIRGDRGGRGFPVRELLALLIELPSSLSFKYFFTLLSLDALEAGH